MKPKKHLGQHFLSDDNIARKIVACLRREPAGETVEIGPGMGVLTRLLIAEGVDLHAVEFDEEAVEYLRALFPNEKLQLHHADFLKWDIKEHLKGPAHFIGNLPYNVSSPIFFRLLEHLEWVLSGTFMVQKEVAQRICAPPGNKVYGILSVLLGYYFELKYQFSVSPKVFRPPPKVNSAVFTLRRLPLTGKVPPAALKTVVKAAFGQRRKTLRNALGQLELADFPEKAHLLTQRAEQLEIPQFEQLTRAYLAARDQ